MTDMNALADLAAFKRAEGGIGRRKDGPNKVHKTSKAYDDARGFKYLSAWDRLLVETKSRWQSAAQTAIEHFRVDCLTSKDGFYHGDSIPF